MYERIIIFALIVLVRGRKNVCRNLVDYKTAQNNPNCWFNPDVGAAPAEIVKRYGFPFESHEIITKDGYILNLFRVPHNGRDVDRKRPPVFLQHGVAVDSTNWMLLGAQSLVFVLANNGFDVWLSNSRGTEFSHKHKRLTAFDPEYWNFSFHEIAIYDVPAMIDFIVSKTGQRITYIGHSMGSTISYVYGSLRRRHAYKNLKRIISLAPVAYMDHVGALMKSLVPYRDLIWNVLISKGLYGLGANTQPLVNLIRKVCSETPAIITCATIVGQSQGANPEEAIFENLPVALGRYPSGFSLKTLLHFTQIIASLGRFQYFDYGIEGNLKLYNSTIPPEYPLNRINVPVHLFYGKNDQLSVETDVMKLHTKLKTEKTIREVFHFGHADFLVGKHAVDFYRLLLEYMR